MNFFNKNSDLNKLENTVFAVLEKYHQDLHPDKINATIGSLCDENNKVVSFESVYTVFKSLSNFDYTKYPQGIIGNQDFRNTVYDYTFRNLITLKSQTVATCGGTGAIYLAFKNYLNSEETILIPNICWDSYNVMANEFKLKTKTYQMFDLNDFKFQASEIIKTQRKLVVLINDPAHNPTGISLGLKIWQDIINFLNQFKDIPIIIIHDLAYIDYCENRDFLKAYNLANDNIIIHCAISLSKGFTMYGQRIGACTVFNQKQNIIDDCLTLFEKNLRSTVSCCNNAAMKTFVEVINNYKEDYLKEIKNYIDIIKNRAQLFISKINNRFAIYPYNEGFFITLKLTDNIQRDAIFNELIKQHVYLVKVNSGLRIAICSLSLNQIEPIVEKIATVTNNTK